MEGDCTMEFYMKLAGVTFEGRQRVLAGLREGQELVFVPDPTNPYDSHAVKVMTTSGVQVGFVPRERNSAIFNNLIHRNGTYIVYVSAVTGGGFNSVYGCNIRVIYNGY